MAAPRSDFDPLTATATQLQALLNSGHITSVKIVETYLAQIEAHNIRGLGLRAISSVAPKDILLSRARQLDDERRAGNARGALHGIPIVVKDNIVTGPELGLSTTAGMVAFQGTKTSRGAPLIQQLQDAGMIILGKTSMSEHRSIIMPAGYSADMGHTSPGGSSSGSAVAVAAGFAPVSLGVDTTGSVVLPANRAALFSIRLTTTSVDIRGILQLCRGRDTVGPMAKTAADLTPLVEAIITPEAKRAFLETGLKSGCKHTFHGLRLGVVEFDQWAPLGSLSMSTTEELDQMRHDYKEMILALESNCAAIEYPIEVPFAAGVRLNGKGAMDITYAEFDQYLQKWAEYFTDWGNTVNKKPINTLLDLTTFNRKHQDQAMPKPYSEQKELLKALEAKSNSAKSGELAQSLKKSARDGLLKVFDSVDKPVDIIVAPADSMLVAPVATAGFTIGTVPFKCLRSTGQPQGLFVAAKANNETTLLKFMSAWEAAFPAREIPSLLR